MCERTDRVLPRWMDWRMEVLPPIRAFWRTDAPEPRRANCRMLIDDPRTRNESTDAATLHLAAARTDNAEPRCIEFKTDNDVCITTLPCITETDDPRRAS
jgi:hypothetical protein